MSWRFSCPSPHALHRFAPVHKEGVMRAGIVIGALAVAVAIASPAQAASTCNLGPAGQIKHVVILQFDNTHLARDTAGVPSDLEQMPALRDFLAGNGSLLPKPQHNLISPPPGGSGA